jgi:hypothetical protein
MSRYYRITISDPKTGEVLVPHVQGKPGFSRVPADPMICTYGSLFAGMTPQSPYGTNAAAQLVELDIPVKALHTPVSNAYFKIWGVSLGEISQASNLNFLNVKVEGGMARGLPLANPNQAGLLAAGQIRQAFGNWVGTDQTLEIYMAAGGSSPSSNQTTGNPDTDQTTPLPSTFTHPANIVFQWKAGQPLILALTTALSGAFPKYQIQGAISPNLVRTGSTATNVCGTLEQFAAYIHEVSLSVISGYAPNLANYSGVFMVLLGSTIVIGDGTTQTTPKKIAYNDLIGQPTWGQTNQVQVMTVLRGDIQMGDYVTLPDGPGTITAGSNSQFANFGTTTNGSAKPTTIFKGTFFVAAVRHVGNSRSPAGQSWITVFDLVLASTAAGQTVPGLPVLYRPDEALSFYLP